MNEDAVSKYLSERGGNDAQAKKLTAEQSKGIAKKAARASAKVSSAKAKAKRKQKGFVWAVSSMYEHLSSTAIDGAAFVRSVEGFLRALSNVRIGEADDSKGYFYFDEASRKSRTNCEQYRLSCIVTP
jgi:hypothetical protein